jgi:hypothetical protein
LTTDVQQDVDSDDMMTDLLSTLNDDAEMANLLSLN